MKGEFKENSSTADIKLQTLYIGFRGYQVAVRSKACEVLEEIERGFREMLEFEPTSIVGQLEVYWKDGEYYLLGSSEADISNETLSDILSYLKYEIVLCLIQASSELLWLHAAAAANRGSAVVIPGLSGRGKSTLVTNLCSLGWTYLSDDVLPVSLDSSKAIPFPRLPAVRENAGQELLPERVHELTKIEVSLNPEIICRKAMPIQALIFPTYIPQSPTQLLPLSPAFAALELLQNCLNFVHHKQAAVRYVCDLVRRIPTYRLSYSNGRCAAMLIETDLEKGV
ncbi:MAG: hypothetical protein F6K21_15095 [Symploca sp. SIO2D2]|nr:hypothetical protein [Symploca sp. SIO2D2]